MGFSEPVARQGLEAELRAWIKPGAIDSVLREIPSDLDPARCPRTVLIIAARTLPASTMRAALMARLLGARVVIKPAKGQEALVQALAQADPQITEAGFTSDHEDATRAAIASSDAVVVLGSDETLATLRAMTPPHVAFVGYGHRLSVAWLGASDDASLLALARDVCAWDQAGCLSPQVAWTSDEPRRLLERLSAAFKRVEAALPMTLSDAGRRERHVARTYGEMTGEVCETDTALLCALEDATFRASPGRRTLWLLPADPEAMRRVEDHLSTVGISGKLSYDLKTSVRRCALGEMQRPELTWAHDGMPNLTPMLRP